MARGSKISILGLYHWNPDLFSRLVLPEDLDHDTFVDNLLMEYAELEVVYPDPEFMQDAIGRWSQMRLHAWERMQKVLYEDYEPFINIKRDELRTITEDRDLKGTGDTTGKVSAWNDTGMVDRAKDESVSTQTGKVVTTETFHVEGDSAITDAQDVLKKEMDVRIKYDLYRLILAEFKERFCLLVY